ncbi:MAG: hypothetical protein D3924_16625, partial [Candidatus Electrothrix sp. AR4]|nr:hypothetical protein [Candidatus Electrothrix sp. AR4]
MSGPVTRSECQGSLIPLSPADALLNTSPLIDHLDHFLQHLTVHRRLSKNTVDSYGSDLQFFIDFLHEQEIHSPEDITEEQVRSFLK